MPDWGMWNMINNPIYNGYGNWWYPDSVCIQSYCNVLIDSCDNDYNAGHARGIPTRIYRCPEHYRSESKKRTDRRESHPITGERRQNWKSAKAKELGGRRGEPGWEDKLYEAQALWESDVKGHLLNTAPAQEVIAFIQSRKSEFGQSIPMTRRETVHVEGEKVDEGWVYVFKCYTSLENHPWVRWVYKIGKTYPDGIGGRMSTARGFARVDFIDKFWFEEAEVSEKEVHTILEPFNLRTLGYTNCGKEMFMCSLEQAVSAINEVEKIGNTKEQALG